MKKQALQNYNNAPVQIQQNIRSNQSRVTISSFLIGSTQLGQHPKSSSYKSAKCAHKPGWGAAFVHKRRFETHNASHVLETCGVDLFLELILVDDVPRKTEEKRTHTRFFHQLTVGAVFHVASLFKRCTKRVISRLPLLRIQVSSLCASSHTWTSRSALRRKGLENMAADTASLKRRFGGWGA
jgi:hypothetical protein